MKPSVVLDHAISEIAIDRPANGKFKNLLHPCAKMNQDSRIEKKGA